jgi:hypothetical protein
MPLIGRLKRDDAEYERGVRANGLRAAGMAAQIGSDELEFYGDLRLDLLTEVTRVQPEPGRDWARLEGPLGFRSTQRLQVSDGADGIAITTWPAELAPQARYLYGGRLGTPLVAAALQCGWKVEATPHIAYHRAAPDRRLYLRPSIAPLEYAALWEDEGALRRLSYSREDVENELWPRLKQQGLVNDNDDNELLRFLDKFLQGRAHLRPGLRLRRIWAPAETARLGPALAEAIRGEFNIVFSGAREPMLGPGEVTGPRPPNPGLGAPYRQARVVELPGSLEPFSFDPATVERGLKGHADTQNALARVLRSAGIEPRSCQPPEPNFDLAWQRDETVFVAEVKSTTASNEEEQLRLGLGQVLRYRQRLAALGHERVIAVLVPEHQPHDAAWRELCQELGVILLSGNELELAPSLDPP